MKWPEAPTIPTGQANRLRLADGKTLADAIVADLYANAERIAHKTVRQPPPGKKSWDARLDDILTSRAFGYPVMLALLAFVFWLTIAGANIPSEWLSDLFAAGQAQLTAWCESNGVPVWLHGLLVLGVYNCAAWVVAVMLPPMAIFFPLFTLLEDLGYLPRVAFNMDCFFKKCKACGKQALTMCMGFGCNAAGVIACRIIDSPRERLIAMLTNNFVPCNGRFPTLIAIGTIFFGGQLAGAQQGAAGALVVTAIVLLGVAVTFLASWLLSHTLLKGEPSSLILELPPYRPPQVGGILYRSIIDRTLFVLRRAILMAAPAGAVIWLLANTTVGGSPTLVYLAGWLQPVAEPLGLDGFILLAFLLGLPANEIVVPILIMSYLAAGQMIEPGSLEDLRQILLAHGWTWLTAFNTMLFCLLHWPCSTTLLTAYKESGSKKWTAVAFLLPTAFGLAACFIVTAVARGLGLA